MSQAIVLSRTNPTYALPLQARIKFTSLDAQDTYFTFSPMENIREINLMYMDVERAVSETGTMNMVIEDSQNVLAKDHINNARVTIELGKTLASLTPYFVGYADNFDDSRPRSYYQEYRVNGPSTKIRASELKLLYRKSADDPNNPNYGIGNLICEMIKKRKWRPLDRDDVEEETGWHPDLVSDGGYVADELNNIINSRIAEVFSTPWDFLEHACALTGAFWDIDYLANFEEILTVLYPSGRGTGITVKSSDLATANDNPEKTAYIYDAFTLSFNSGSDAGVATGLYTTTVIDQEVISSQQTNNGAATLVNVARAQQLVVQNDERRITGVNFIISKIGAPESPNDRVNGDLVMDSGDNQPTGATLATFNFPISDLKTTPTNVFVDLGDKVKVRFLSGRNVIWIRLFQRSGLKGDPDGDTANTIRWHHNGLVNTTQPVYTAVSSNNQGEYKLRDTMTWSSQNQGPIFCYSVFSKINRLQSRFNGPQAKILRLKEDFIDTSFINDIAGNNLFLSRELARRSKTKATISSLPVTIPNNFLFRPYQVVSFADSLSNQFLEMAVQRARYVISAQAGEASPLGALNCEITLGALFNPIIGSCSCL